MNVTAQTRKARVEIIPLIDVIFFLLATFVLFTLALNKLQSLDLVFPKPGGTEVLPMVTIQVVDSGAVLWDDELIGRQELRPRLEAYRHGTNDPRVFVKGGEEAKFGDVIGVFDEVRGSGISRVTIQTQAVRGKH